MRARRHEARCWLNLRQMSAGPCRRAAIACRRRGRAPIPDLQTATTIGGFMKKVLHALFCIVLLAAAVGTRAQAQTTPPNWPTRPIRLIVPPGPGLGTDIMARLLADGVSRTLGQQIY